jgi:hypothetical protein
MRTLKLAQLLHSARPADPKLRNGYAATCIAIAKGLLATDLTVSAPGFLEICGVTQSEQDRLASAA